MFDILKMHLSNNGYDNHIYFCLTENEINELKLLLNEDYGYIDLVIDFDDLNKLDKLINSVPEDSDKTLMIRYIYSQYIIYKIVSQIEINDEYNMIGSIEEKKESIFSGDFELFKNSKITLFMIIERELEKLAKNKNTRARIHFLLDGVNNKILQQVINDFFYLRSPICFMGYTSKDSLLHYYNTMGSVLESPHDYSKFYPNGYIYNKYVRVREKYDID